MCLRIAWVLLALTIARPPAIAAQTPSATASATAQTTGEAPSAFDQIWKFSQWYENTSNPVIQRVLFSGRFHEDFSNVHADQGDHHEWNVRRLRFGPRITFLRDYLFHVEIDLNPQERDPTYVRLTDLYVRWTRSAPLAITVGKQSVPFTQEGATSSRELRPPSAARSPTTCGFHKSTCRA